MTAAGAPSDIVLYGKVYDIAGDGSATLIHRLIAPIRVFDSGEPVDMQLLGFAHRFSSGHRVRLELAATDMTSGNNRPPDLVTLTQSAGADPSTFSLPVDSTAGTVTQPPGGGGPGSQGPGMPPPPVVAGPVTPTNSPAATGPQSPAQQPLPNSAAGTPVFTWQVLPLLLAGILLLVVSRRRTS
jgi:hypothetical protein